MKSRLQVVIPAYNEELRIDSTLRDLFQAADQKQMNVEVIVVLNGCRDNTKVVVEKFKIECQRPIEILEFVAPIGKGRAIIEGFKISTAPFVSFMDADGSVSAHSVLSLWERIGRFDVAIGSRRCPGAKILIQQPLLRRWAGQVYATLTRFLLNLPFYDTQCGGKILKLEVAHLVAERCQENGWAFDVAMLDLILRSGYSVTELPVVWTNDDRSKVNLFRDGPRMLKSLFALRISSRGRRHESILMVQHHFIHQGTFKRCFKFAEQIATRRRHISILCIDPNNKSLWPQVHFHTDNPYVELLRLPIYGSSKNPLSILFRAIVASLWLFSRGKYDLIHLFAVGHPFNAILTVTLTLARRGRQYAMDWDDLWGGGYGNYLSRPINKILEWQERWLPRWVRPSFFSTASHALQSRVVANGYPQDKTFVLVNGCDEYTGPIPIDRREICRNLHLAPERTYGISIGNTYSEQSFRNLLAAFRKAHAKNSQIQLLLLGDFSKYGSLGKSIQRLKNQHQQLFEGAIHTPGLVSLEKMFAYLSVANFAILPMENTPIDLCRFPIRFGDYVSTHKLIVSNAVGEIERIMREENIGYRCAPDDVSGFAKNILAASKAQQHEDLHHDMKRVQQKYSWRRLAGQLNKMYDNILNQSNEFKNNIKQVA